MCASAFQPSCRRGCPRRRKLDASPQQGNLRLRGWQFNARPRRCAFLRWGHAFARCGATHSDSPVLSLCATVACLQRGAACGVRLNYLAVLSIHTAMWTPTAGVRGN